MPPRERYKPNQNKKKERTTKDSKRSSRMMKMGQQQQQQKWWGEETFSVPAVSCVCVWVEGPHKTLKETPARADLDRPTDPQRPYDAKPTIRQNLIFCEK